MANSYYKPVSWVDVGFAEGDFNFKPASVKYSMHSGSSAAAADMFMKVAKPIRLVYEKNGERYHLLLGNGEKDLPMGVEFHAIHTYYTPGYSVGGLFDTPEILQEIEITLKMRVKNYTIKKIETE